MALCLLHLQIYIKVSDSNDNTPIFSEHTYEVLVSEDTPADTEVLRVRARDRDERAKLSYSIHSSVDPASMRMFRINPGTGVMYTADRLDYEARTQHILTIMVRNNIFLCSLMQYIGRFDMYFTCDIQWGLRVKLLHYLNFSNLKR